MLHFEADVYQQSRGQSHLSDSGSLPCWYAHTWKKILKLSEVCNAVMGVLTGTFIIHNDFSG